MKKTFALFLLVVVWLGHAAALEVPKLTGHVNDYAGMISPPVREQIGKDLANLERTDSTQIFVLTVPSLEGEVLEEYAIKVFDTWKAGQKKLDNGVILIVAQKERKIRIEVGRGLEGKLTDLAAGRIIDTVMKPRFKANDFDGGFADGISSLIQATKGEFKAAGRSKSDDNAVPLYIGRFEKLPHLAGAALGLVIALAVLIALKVIKTKKVSVAAGAAAMPIIVLLTIGHMGDATALGIKSMLCFLVFMLMGGLVALFSGVLADPATYRLSTGGRGGGYGGDSDWSSGSSSSGSDSGGSDSGDGGSSGGGGASGDY